MVLTGKRCLFGGMCLFVWHSDGIAGPMGIGPDFYLPRRFVCRLRMHAIAIPCVYRYTSVFALPA